MNDTLNTILKYEGDIRKAQDELKDYLQKQRAKAASRGERPVAAQPDKRLLLH